MKARKDLNIIRRMILVSVLPVALLFLALAASFYSGRYIGDFTRDPLSVAGAPFFLGFISNVGVLFWWSSATIALGAGFYFRTQTDNLQWSRFLTLLGLFTAFLTLDDLFRLHEHVFPDYFGISENAVFAVYGVFLLSLLVSYRGLLKSEVSFYLVVALTLFALSVLIDLLLAGLIPLHHLFEDGFKFVGITAWLAFVLEVTWSRLQCSAKTS